MSPRLILLLFFLPGAAAWAQTSPARSPFSLGMRLHYGFIIAHSKELIDVSGSKPRGFELNAQWWLTDEKYTRRSGLVAKRGVVLQYVNYDNPQVLGSVVSVIPYVEPMIRPWRRLNGSVQMGIGMSYLTRVYDAETNPTNLFFSTPLSFLMMVNGYLNYRVDERWGISAGINYNHISNGGMKEPNKGMNFPTYNAGVQYHLRPPSVTRPVKTDDWKQQSRNMVYALAVGTIKRAVPTPGNPGNEPTAQLGVQLMAGRRVGRMSALSAGTEWIHDGFTRTMLDREGDDTNAWKGSLLAGHELLVGRVRFNIHLGAYLYNPSRHTNFYKVRKISDAFYQRYGLHYQAGRRLLFGVTLKAHRHVADVLDVRAGVSLGR